MPDPRSFCYRCSRPAGMCLCGAVPRLPNRTGIHVLQHRHERRHALGTARLLRLGLERVRVDVLSPDHVDGTCPPVGFAPRTGLLYLAPDAIDLAGLAPEDRPEHLVLLDGTWAQAHRLYRDNAWIRALPHYCLRPEAPSNYRIRKEPRAECLSTVEAVVEAIRHLEPELDGVDGLAASFVRMIDDQIAATARSAQPGRVAWRAPKARAARVVFDEADRVVVVHAEPGGAGQLLQLVAVALGTGAVFDAVVLQDVLPDEYHRSKLQLDDAAFDEGLAEAEALRRFDAFCGDDAVLASWGPCTARLLDGRLARHVPLKAEWANRTRVRVPGADEVARGLGVPAPPLPVRGRAGQHLAWAAVIAQALRETGA